MVMVDRLLHCDTVVTETERRSVENYDATGWEVYTPATDEAAHATCAARMGYINLSSGKEVRMGVIGALREMEIHRLPEIGSTIKTRIEVSDEVFGMTLAQAQSYCDNTLLYSGTIKIALL